MTKERFIHKVKHDSKRLVTTVKWVAFSFLTGIIMGGIGAAFYHGVVEMADFRAKHPAVLLLLPVGGVIILLFYHVLHQDRDGGTNLVLQAIQSNDEIPLRMSVLIFVSTTFSHFVGASVGREGAALQLGGSIGNALGKLFRFNETDKKTLIMCGMSAVFAALFGTPAAAAVFSMEVVSVGIMHYAALVPCVISAFVARRTAALLGAAAPSLKIDAVPDFDLLSAARIGLLAACCGLVSILFCFALRIADYNEGFLFKNRYLKSFICGTSLLILTVISGSQIYNGSGTAYIQHCLNGDAARSAFIFKIIFTALSIAAGYKGGEIVPSLFIGAAFGSCFGTVIGFSPELCAAMGMGSVFCGVTNCPITSMLICFELFGFESYPFIMLSVAISYMISGYYGLYSSQKIMYSKFQSNYINKKTHH